MVRENPVPYWWAEKSMSLTFYKESFKQENQRLKR